MNYEIRHRQLQIERKIDFKESLEKKKKAPKGPTPGYGLIIILVKILVKIQKQKNENFWIDRKKDKADIDGIKNEM